MKEIIILLIVVTSIGCNTSDKQTKTEETKDNAITQDNSSVVWSRVDGYDIFGDAGYGNEYIVANFKCKVSEGDSERNLSAYVYTKDNSANINLIEDGQSWGSGFIHKKIVPIKITTSSFEIKKLNFSVYDNLIAGSSKDGTSNEFLSLLRTESEPMNIQLKYDAKTYSFVLNPFGYDELYSEAKLKVW